MGSRIQVRLLVISLQILLVAGQTNDQDFAALNSLKDVWKNTPLSWVASDPCGNSWEGIWCNDSRVTAMDLSYNKGLTGSLPSSIGNLKKLTNLILVGCRFSCLIPATIGSLQQLCILYLNSNSFSGQIPSAIGNLSNLYWLDQADNKLSGTIPVSNGTTPGLDMLVNTKHFRFGKNQLSGKIPSQLFSSKMTLIHVMMENTRLQGHFPQLQTVVLRNNQLNDTLDVGSSYSDQLHLIDLRNNYIVGFTERAGFNIELILAGNPVCEDTGGTITYCIIQESNAQYSTPLKNCMPVSCGSNQISSPNCRCAYPYIGTLFFRAPSFSYLGNSNIYTSLEISLMQSFQSHQLPVDPSKNTDDYFVLSLKVFPSGQVCFNRPGISGIGFVLSNQTFKSRRSFGPFFFHW